MIAPLDIAKAMHSLYTAVDATRTGYLHLSKGEVTNFRGGKPETK